MTAYLGYRQIENYIHETVIYERITSTLFQVYAPAATIGAPMTQRIDLVMPAPPQ